MVSGTNSAWHPPGHLAIGPDTISGPRALVVNRECKRIRRDRLRNRTRPNQSHGNPAGDYRSVFNNLNFLQVLAIHPFGDAGRFPPVSAQILSLAAFDLLIAAAWLQVSVQLQLSGSLDAFVLLQGTHGPTQFLIRR